MNPVLESTFATEPDLYCIPGIECEKNRQGETHLVLTSDELFTILQDHARRSRNIASGITNALKQTSAALWGEHIGPFVNKPGTAPAGLLAADAYMLSITAKTVYTGKPMKVIFNNRDLPILKRIVQSLCGFATRVSLSTDARGVQWIVLKGRPGLRTLLDGTRYLASNPRMLQLGIGTAGLKSVARGGFVTAVVVSSAVEVGNWYFNDSATLADLTGGVIVEVAKAGIGIRVALMFGTAVAGGASFVAVAPLGVMIAVSFGIGYALNIIDAEVGMKAYLQKMLNNIPVYIQEGWYRVERDSLIRFEELKNEYDIEVQRLKNQAIQRTLAAGELAAKNVADAALKSARRKVENEVGRLLGSRIK